MGAAISTEALKRVASGARALTFREAVTGIVDSFRDNDLTVQAGAIAFRVLLSLVPVLLFIFGALGFLGLDAVWRADIAPDLKASVSPPAFQLINDAVVNVLGSQQVFWVTIGLGIALWEVSGIVRSSQQVLLRIHDVSDERTPLRERFGVSLAVGGAVGAAVIGAIVTVRLGPLLIEDVLGDGALASAFGFVVRWALALGLLLFAVGIVLRTAPRLDRPLHWVSFGAVVVVSAWVVSSVLFWIYLTQIADYGSIFGNLATVFVLSEYLYVLSIVFLGGLVLDALVEGAS